MARERGKQLLTDLGAWDDSWRCPGCGPVEYIARAGLLNDRLLAVHGVHLTDAELARLAAARRDARDLSSQQHLDRCRSAANRALL